MKQESAVITGTPERQIDGLLLNASQAARLLGVSRWKFYQIREALPAILLPDGTKKFNREQLEWWLAHNTELGTTQAKRTEVSK